MNGYDRFRPSETEIDAEAMRIMNAGGWVHKERFNEMVDEWIDEQTELRHQAALDAERERQDIEQARLDQKEQQKKDDVFHQEEV